MCACMCGTFTNTDPVGGEEFVCMCMSQRVYMCMFKCFESCIHICIYIKMHSTCFLFRFAAGFSKC